MSTEIPASGLHVVSVCSIGRRDHLARQLDAVRRWLPEAVHHTVMIGPEPFEVPGSRTVDRTGPGPVNLAAARNAAGDAAAAAGAQAIVFLDADCLPGPGLGSAYLQGLAAVRDDDPARPAVLCGAVTYLGQEDSRRVQGEGGLELLPELTAPHAARPALPAGERRRAEEDEHVLFWSLSFALTARSWRAVRQGFGGFCEEYTGYGGEDTDFAMELRRAEVPLHWVGGADAYHQWHPVSSPPVEHLEAILRNAALFRSRWGWWPMEGWLEAFRERGLVRFDGADWHLVPQG